jgi:SAM-dependent methyltransferase
MNGANDDWTSGFFDDPYTEFFPFPDAPTTDAEVDALLQLLPSPPARILDVACGQGRHSLRLAERGFQVLGVDRSTAFLNAARSATAGSPADVEFVELDMRDLAFDQRFDAALSLFTAWGYFDDQTNQQILHRIARSLRAGGHLVMDLIHRDWLMGVYTPKDWTALKDGNFAVVERNFDPISGTNLVTHRWLTRTGERHERHHRLRVYTATELSHMLHQAGLVPVAWYGGFTLEPFGFRSRRMLIHAEKAARDPS